MEDVQNNKEKLNTTEDDKKEEEKKERNIKKKSNNKRIKKLIVKSIKKISKKRNKKNENKNIDSYLIKKEIQQENDNSTTYKNINKKLFVTHYINNNQNEINGKEFLKKINEEINNNNFSLLKNNKIRYNSNFLNNIEKLPSEIKEFYSLDSKSINENNKDNYILILKNYLLKHNSLNNIDQYDKINNKNKKLIFIHNSFNKLKNIPNEISKKINPRNYLIKDEYLIDYEKDSEDEYLEENAEDIKSNDNEEDEDDLEDIFSISQKDANKFLVPDGHLSQSEVSDYDLIEQRRLFQKSKSNLIDIKSFLNIRKNYIKPILIDFTKAENNDKIMILSKKLSIGLVNFDTIKDINEIDNNFNANDEVFPIVIKKKINNYKGIQDSIRNHFQDIIKKIHGSYDTKDHLINEINQQFDDISKNILNNFFKDKCMKIHKKYWIVKDEILNQFNLNIDDMDKIKKDNYNIYKEREEKKTKNLETIKQKDEMMNTKNENIEINISDDKSKDKDNIFEITKSQKLDKILINTKEYEGLSIEVLESDSNQSNKNELYNNIDDRKSIIELKSNEEEESLIVSIEKNNQKKNKKKKKRKSKKKKIVFDDEDYEFNINDNKRKSTRIRRNNNISKISKINKIGKMSKIERKIMNNDNSSDKSKSKNKDKKKDGNNKLINEYFNISEK